MISPAKKHWLRHHRRALLLGGPALLLLAAGVIYLTGGRYVSTDDAYVQSARTQISSNIAGRVTRIAVQDNQQVHQGDILFTLDDRDMAIAIEDAKARLANARLEIAALKSTYREQQANVQAAKDTLDYAQREFTRQKTLAAQGISSQAQLDAARHAFETAQQQVKASQEARENVRASLAGDAEVNAAAHPAVQQAQAALDKAELNLSYTTVRAPIDGIVSKVEQLQLGDYIQPAVPLFALVSPEVWVEANFKETQLGYMRPGQPATIEIDSIPGRKFHGKVESLSPGTGSSFSLLPPENASGNWVKVVQRLPVRISIDDADPQLPLTAGLSANVRVDTEHSRLKGRL